MQEDIPPGFSRPLYAGGTCAARRGLCFAARCLISASTVVPEGTGS
jgi:hypothetical protein